MTTKLTPEQKQKADAWFRKNRLPQLETPGKIVRFRVRDELDENGRVRFAHTICDA
jgi:hypothetical protein